jgi:hypothetical protein
LILTPRVGQPARGSFFLRKLEHGESVTKFARLPAARVIITK